MKRSLFLISALILLPPIGMILAVTCSVIYHEIKVWSFSKQLEEAAKRNKIEEYFLESSVSADTGSGPYCAYTTTIMVTLKFESQAAKIANEPFQPAEPGGYSKVDVNIRRENDRVIVTLFDGARPSLLDPRCL